MSFIQCDKLSYSYTSFENNKNVEIKALEDVSITINKGEFVAILGHNGSGKSTFGKILNGLLVPEKGRVFVNGFDCSDEKNILSVRKSLAMIFQNPDNQLVSSIVEDEVAFGCENLGIPSSEIRKRVDFALKKVGMYEYKDAVVSNLSGGQKQRIAIAGIIAMKPEGIIFDEATAMLDPRGRKDVLDIAKELNSEGMTVIFITHYMEEAIDADTIYVFNRGKISMSGSPRDVFSNYDKIMENKLELPYCTELSYKLGLKNSLTVEEFADNIAEFKTNEVEITYKSYDNQRDDIIKTENVSYVYQDSNRAVDGISVDIKKGDFVCVIGPTGSGKSTFIQLLNGIYKPKDGFVFFNNEDIKNIKNINQKVGIIFQYPEDQIFEANVFDEVAFAPKNMGLSKSEVDARVKEALDFVNIDQSYYTKSPMHLSGGEKRKIAIASVLAMKPDVLLLDEPVAGLDPQGRNDIMNKLNDLKLSGTTIVMIVHSMDIVGEFADKVMVMKNGKMIDYDTPPNVFRDTDKILNYGLDIPNITKLFKILNDKGIHLPYAYDKNSALYILKKALGK